METRSSEQQLSSPLWQPAPPGTDDGDNVIGNDPYAALSSTKARKLLDSSLLSAIVGGGTSTPTTSVATSEDEADAAAGSLHINHQPELTPLVLSMILFFSVGGVLIFVLNVSRAVH